MDREDNFPREISMGPDTISIELKRTGRGARARGIPSPGAHNSGDIVNDISTYDDKS
jgi:hypothetical protein